MQNQGLVISNLGKGLAVEPDGSDRVILCKTRRNLQRTVTGDRVLFEYDGDNEGIVTSILPRSNLLSRPARNSRTKPVAANLDQLVVLFSVSPACDLLLLDQFLVVCELSDYSPLLVFNKTDLIDHEELARFKQVLAPYFDMDYQFRFISAKTGDGVSTLKEALMGKRSLLVGQSGVGKSSLTNALLPEMALRTNTVSDHSGLGRHTTTTATLYHLPDGGDLIDSPGVNIFGLAGVDEQLLAKGFRDFQPFLDKCRFNDCRHLNDMGCAVTEAVEQDKISSARYQRFLKLREKLSR